MLVTPQLLTYFSAGYTEAHYNSVNLLNSTSVLVRLALLRALTLVAAPTRATSLALATSTRWASCPACSGRPNTASRIWTPQTNNDSYHCDQRALDRRHDYNSHKYVHTIRSELVYRFNWGGPVVAKY